MWAKAMFSTCDAICRTHTNMLTCPHVSYHHNIMQFYLVLFWLKKMRHTRTFRMKFGRSPGFTTFAYIIRYSHICPFSIRNPSFTFIVAQIHCWSLFPLPSSHFMRSFFFGVDFVTDIENSALFFLLLQFIFMNKSQLVIHDWCYGIHKTDYFYCFARMRCKWMPLGRITIFFSCCLQKKFVGKKYSQRKVSEGGQCRCIEQTSSTVAVELASHHFFL